MASSVVFARHYPIHSGNVVDAFGAVADVLHAIGLEEVAAVHSPIGALPTEDRCSIQLHIVVVA